MHLGHLPNPRGQASVRSAQPPALRSAMRALRRPNASPGMAPCSDAIGPPCAQQQHPASPAQTPRSNITATESRVLRPTVPCPIVAAAHPNTAVVRGPANSAESRSGKQFRNDPRRAGAPRSTCHRLRRLCRQPRRPGVPEHRVDPCLGTSCPRPCPIAALVLDHAGTAEPRVARLTVRVPATACDRRTGPLTSLARSVAPTHARRAACVFGQLPHADRGFTDRDDATEHWRDPRALHSKPGACFQQTHEVRPV